MVRERIQGADRLQVAKIITKVVKSKMEIDDAALNDGIVDQRTTEDILKSRMGVCQHFAVVFAAIARAIGIPARIVAGYLITYDEESGHAWVEVKLNDNVWWPLDPEEDANERLPYRGYLPTVEVRWYEAEADTIAGRFDQLMKMTETNLPWQNATIEKLPH
jgi:hypothetical protein